MGSQQHSSIPIPSVTANGADGKNAPEESAIREVKAAEREWHDDYYRTHFLEAFPSTAEEFQRIFTRVELTPFCEGGWSWWADSRREALDSIGDVRGLRVLDYGCGFGGLGVYLALQGAEVRGFDLSREGVEAANHYAAQFRVIAQFEQMDAEELTYADNFFDLVVGFGVLHHVVKYRRAADQLFRVLKPGGRAVFHETLWDNPLINLVRGFTGEDKDAGDAHLTERNVREFCADFTQIKLEKRNLFYMLRGWQNCRRKKSRRP